MRRLHALPILLFCPAVLTAQPDWIPLFDGKSLAGWSVACRPEDRGREFWKVQDGAITCDSRGRKDHHYVWLMHEREFADFELKVRVRGFRESTGNTGVQVRSRYDWDAFWLDGPQVDVHPPAPWRSGLIYDETRGARRWVFPSLPNAKIDDSYAPKGWTWKYAEEQDGWNDIHIRCQGTRIRTSVNGVLAADFDGAGVLDDQAHRERRAGLAGHIALQLHNGDDLYVQFRDILVRPLAASR